MVDTHHSQAFELFDNRQRLFLEGVETLQHGLHVVVGAARRFSSFQQALLELLLWTVQEQRERNLRTNPFRKTSEYVTLEARYRCRQHMNSVDASREIHAEMPVSDISTSLGESFFAQ